LNIHEYILSGITEAYVLGLASEEERKEFEAMCTRYPEVLEARIAFEKSLEQQALANAVTPHPGLKAKLFDILTEEKKETPVKPQAPVRPISWLRYAAAACVVLLAGSVYMNITLSSRNKALKNNYNNSVTALNDLKEELRVFQDVNIKMASLNGTPASPQSFTTVYWDTTSHDVYLLINNLPKPASDKQYQLWAFLDGKPVDMGLIEMTDKPLQLYKCNKAQAAQGFAITLENRNRPDISKPGGEIYVKSQL
jgi:anti-sigma-K factor RskA